ncbi:MAG: ATP-binding protein [Candidatus Omnitrophota bacterium]
MRLGVKFSLTTIIIVVSLGVLLVAISAFIFSKAIYSLDKELFSEKVDRLVLLAYEQDELIFEGLYDDESDAKRRVLDKFRIIYRKQKDNVTFPFIIDFSGKTIVHPESEKHPRVFDKKTLAFINKEKQGDIEYDCHGVRKWCVFKAYEPWGWVFCMSTSIQNKNKDIAVFTRGAIGVSIIIIVISVLIIFIMSHRFVHPIHLVIQRLEAIARGEKNIALQDNVATKSKDEISLLASAVTNMAKNLEKTTVSRDILLEEVTERKKTEEALRKTHEKIGSILESITESYYKVDFQWKILEVNKNYAVTIKKTQEELIGNMLWNIYPKAQYLEMYSKYEEAIKEKKPVHFEFNSHRSLKWYEVHAYPFEDGLSVYFRDISERKDNEKKIKDALQEEKRFREIMVSMLEDNNQVREELEKSLTNLKNLQDQLIHAEKMQAIGRMAAGVAHEVKNPLGIVLQGINYFERVFSEEGTPDNETLQMMKDSIKRADSIVRALLDFSRLDKLSLKLGNINEILESSLRLIEFNINLKNIKVIKELSNDLPPIMYDSIKIEQVLINLYNNAVYAMAENGRLHVRSYISEIKDAGYKAGNRASDIFKLGEKVIIVEVEDTGFGIDDDIKDNIFEPFFTTKIKTDGTGLGLSVSKNIIDMHGGMMNVVSEKNKGTKVTMIFKISRGG